MSDPVPPSTPSRPSSPRTNRPGPRSSTRRPAGPPVKIPAARPDVGKYVPYVLGAVVVGALVFAVRTPRYAHLGALGVGLVVLAVMGYAALSYRISLKPGDSLRALLPIVAVATLAAALVPFAYTLFPPGPRGEVSLAAPGTQGEVEVAGTSSSLWLVVRGRFVPTASGNADYFLTVRKLGGESQRVDGTIRPHEGGPVPDRQVLALRGPGRFAVRLEQASPGLALPLVVAVHAKPFSTLALVLLYLALAAVVLAVDTMLWRRGIEPSYASALLLPLVAVVYFQRNPVGDNLTIDLLAAGAIGALAGGLGGELLARACRAIAGGRARD